MRFKNVVIDGLVRLENKCQLLQMQTNRGVGQTEVLETIEKLKEDIEKLRELIQTEHDEFE